MADGITTTSKYKQCYLVFRAPLKLASLGEKQHIKERQRVQLQPPDQHILHLTSARCKSDGSCHSCNQVENQFSPEKTCSNIHYYISRYVTHTEMLYFQIFDPADGKPEAGWWLKEKIKTWGLVNEGRKNSTSKPERRDTGLLIREERVRRGEG